MSLSILGDPGADSGSEGKSKQAEKYGTKKSKEQREEPLGTMCYQTSSKRSPPFWPLIGARKLVFLSYESPHVRESMTVLDSGFHAVDSGFRVLNSGFRLSGFRILKRAGFQNFFLL